MQTFQYHVQIQASIQVNQARRSGGLFNVFVIGLVVDVRVAVADQAVERLHMPSVGLECWIRIIGIAYEVLSYLVHTISHISVQFESTAVGLITMGEIPSHQVFF